jgi:hypothetical protein
MMTREEIELLLRSCCSSQTDLQSLELGDPLPEKGNYRLGWAILDRTADIAAVIGAIEGKLLHGEKIYCAPNRSYSLQIRVADPAHSTTERLSKDLSIVRTLVERLHLRFGLAISDENILSLVASSGQSEAWQLDMLILYLRRVFFVDFYAASAAAGPQDLLRQAGDMTIRSSDTSAMVETASLAAFDRQIEDLIDRLTHSYEPFSENLMLEKHVAKVDEGRYRCTHCSKLFKGVDFVVKHLRLKHEDLTKNIVLEVATLNVFLQSPVLSSLLPLPVSTSASGRRRSVPNNGGDHYVPAAAGGIRDHYRPREPYRRGPPPPPPKDAVQDPRKVRQYVDWDAPATGDVEINYD